MVVRCTRSLRIALCCCLVAGALGTIADAATVDPSLFGGLHWRLIGPFRGGRVLAVTSVPGEPDHFYFGSVNGGVWETIDAGRTWKPIFDSQPIGSIGAIAVAPSNPRVIYVGSGEADMRSDIAQGDGVYKSTDGGKTWTHVGLRDSQQVGRILVDPANPDLVYVAALGHPYGPNAERGVFRSRDGGAHWEKVLGKDDDTGAIDLAFEPGNPRTIYAALWQTRRPPWNVYAPSNGPGSGLWKSSDGGDHWSELTGNGLPKPPGRIGIAVAPSAPQRVYLFADAGDRNGAGGIYRSDDGGAHFTQTSGDTRVWQRGWYFAGITVEPKDADVVWVANTNLYRSRDGGKTFAPVEGDATGDDFHQLWIDPQRPERRILGVDQGAIVSVDGGASWSSWHNQPTAQMYHVSVDDRFPYWVYGSQQDSGAAGLPSRTTGYDGITMQQFSEVTVGGESDMIAPDPKDPQIVYGGRVDKLDLRTQQTRSIDPTLAFPGEQYRSVWTLPLTFSRREPWVLYFANQKLFRTASGGEQWDIISPDLTREDPGVPPNLDASAAANHLGIGPRRGVIYAIAPSPLVDHDVWVGTDDGKIWRTRDEGAHWSDVTPAGLAAWSKVGNIEPSPFDAESAYAAIDRHRLDDFAPYVYRTRDGGKSWQLAATGIPDGNFVNTVRADPVRRGLLYAATEKGVYVSFDDGDGWQPLQLNLPVTSVRDLVVKDADLVVATHGRGFWILDDMTPLRHFYNAATAGDATVRLFAPSPAVRLRPAGFTGTPLPKDEPKAENPPFGAIIDYLLPAAAKEPVTLEIYDAAGDLVRRYSSADKMPTADPAKLRQAPQWFEPPSSLSAAQGMHRFVWPLHHAAPTELSEGDTWEDGPWALPGAYKLVLTVDGQRLVQPLEVRPDPRIGLNADAYARQLAITLRIDGERALLAKAAGEANRALKALGERIPTAPPKLRGELAALRDRIADVAGVTVMSNPANAWPYPPRRRDSLRFVRNALDGLYQAVQGADADPSADVMAGLNELSPISSAALEAWDALKSRELAEANRRLRRAELKPIEVAPAQ
ncbi:MAG TPA: hypothetical protein VGS57_19305 [Thermoanaerobaculia bacterium]|jgi:photosystem II stability/assembly factor-like uncharacterized protein|nr:hypothetical protein [Thermoanaerobaculia bacterium]